MKYRLLLIAMFVAVSIVMWRQLLSECCVQYSRKNQESRLRDQRLKSLEAELCLELTIGN